MFQHTATRRRLRFHFVTSLVAYDVSTHSYPEAAAVNCNGFAFFAGVSTHSRPKAAAYGG